MIKNGLMIKNGERLHPSRLRMIMEELLHGQQVRPHANPRRVRIASRDGLEDGLVFPVG